MFGKKKWFEKKLIDILPEVRGVYKTDVLLSRYTWFGVGGPAEVMYVPEDEDDLCTFLKTKEYNLPICIIGGGSNLLVRDGGIPGVVIKLDSKYFKQVVVNDNDTITCFAGVKNADLKKVFIEKGISGLEFLCSIPGVIGGSLRTNAGFLGTSISDVLESATVVNGRGEKDVVGVKDLMLTYRGSLFPKDWIITSITFRTKKADSKQVEKIIAEHKEYRVKNQPYNVKTAGSTFKNPEGLKAWQLIQKAGCAGLEINGAKVSEKHCNFLVNTGKATAKDIEDLGEEIIRRVREKTSITLEWEVKRMGILKEK